MPTYSSISRQRRLLAHIMRAMSRPLILATVLVTLGGLTGCSAPTSTTPPGFLRVYGSEPQHPLITTNTNEVGGGDILRYLYRGLTAYKDDGTLYLEHADSITSNADSTEFTITLKPGWTFTNGQPVTAHSYVDAWNFGACMDNLQVNQSFFDIISGYDDVVHTQGSRCHMSGLSVIDDTTFHVKLSHPESGFPLRLGHTPYMPLPAVAFEDIQAFGEHPIGNGQYQLKEGKSWWHNESLTMEANPHYRGSERPRNPGIVFLFYSNLDTAYADLLAGQIDTLGNSVGPTALPSFQTDFPNSNSNHSIASSQAFVIPQWLPHFQGEEGRLRRAAISQALNRDLITQKIFFSTRTPARDFTSPTLDDVLLSIPGSEVLTYRPRTAQYLWNKANKIRPFTGTFEIAYNADGGHQQWIDAACTSLRQVLGISAQGKAYPTFKQLRDDINTKKIMSAFRSGWVADYPSVYNFLEPLYKTGASSNDGDYSSVEFDTLLTRAAQSTDPEEAKKLYRDAQALLMKDLPAIPLWYYNSSTAWNPQLRHVHIGWNGYPNYALIDTHLATSN